MNPARAVAEPEWSRIQVGVEDLLRGLAPAYEVGALAAAS